MLEHTQNQEPPPQFASRGTTIILCLFAFLYIFDPSSPFLVQYLTTSKHIPLQIVIDYVFPIWAYSFPLVQLIIGILSEIQVIGHKWVIVLGIFNFQCSLVLVVFCNNAERLILVQLSEVVFGASMAAHQAFSGLRYHMVAQADYSYITSLTRGVMLFGHTISALIGQILYLLHVDLNYLFVLALLGTLPGLFLAIFQFPAPAKYLIPMQQKPSVKQFFTDIVSCYAHFDVALWSFISVTATAVHYLGLTYYQTLFKTMDANRSYNGFVIAIAYLVATGTSLVPSRIQGFLSRFGFVITIPLLLICGVLLLLLSFPSILNLYVAYALFIAYHALFEFLLVTCTSQIAVSLKVNRFAAIFSFNAVTHNVIQLLLQLIIGEKVLHLDAVGNYRAFATSMLGVFAISLVIYLIRVAYQLLVKMRLPQNGQNGRNQVSINHNGADSDEEHASTL